MRKIFAPILALSVCAASAFGATNKELEKFMENGFASNPQLSFQGFEVLDREPIEGLKGWEKVDYALRAAKKGDMRVAERKGTLFTYKDVFADQLVSLPNAKGKRPSDEVLNDAVKQSLANNKSVSLLSSRVLKRVKIKEVEGWEAAIVELDLSVKNGASERQLSTTQVFFAGKGFLAEDLISVKTGESIKDDIKGDVRPEYYDNSHIIAGDPNGKAKYKIIAFSDPLCPACRAMMPKMIALADKNPKEISLYYYNMPVHAISATLMKAAIASRLAGNKNAERDMYLKDLVVKTGDDLEALKIFNSTYGTKLELSDINEKAVLDRYNREAKVAMDLAINSTPSFFINGKYDGGKRAELQKIIDRLAKK